jgi:hypothetical protein
VLGSPVTYFFSVPCERTEFLTSCHLAAATVYTEAEYGVEMRFELKAISLFVQKVAADLSGEGWRMRHLRR